MTTYKSEVKQLETYKTLIAQKSEDVQFMKVIFLNRLNVTGLELKFLSSNELITFLIINI